MGHKGLSRRSPESGPGMNWDDIRLLYFHEIRCALRERNVMLYVVLVPALLYPLLVWLTMTSLSFVMGQSERTALRITTGALPAACSDLVAELKRDIKGAEVTSALFTTPPTSLEGADVLLNFQGESSCQVLFDSSRFRSISGKERVENFLRHYRDKKLEDKGHEFNLRTADMQLFGVVSQNLSSHQDVGRYLLGVLLPFTLIVILSLGGMYSAIDCTAGERERSTWETSLTLASNRTNLVIAKYLYVTTMSSTAGMFNLVAMTFSLRSFVTPILPDVANQITMSLPLQAIPVIVLGTITLSGLLSAVMMLLASVARTFREGQALVSPLFLLMLVPSTIVMDKSVEFDRNSALIPVVNVALLWRESLQGQFQLELFAITVIVCLIGVAFCLLFAQGLMAQESLLLDGGMKLWKKFVPYFISSRIDREP